MDWLTEIIVFASTLTTTLWLVCRQKPAEAQPAERKPAEARLASPAPQSAEQKLVESSPAPVTQSTKQKPSPAGASQKLAEQKQSDTEPAPVASQPGEQKPVESQPAPNLQILTMSLSLSQISLQTHGLPRPRRHSLPQPLHRPRRRASRRSRASQLSSRLQRCQLLLLLRRPRNSTAFLLLLKGRREK